MTRGGTGAPLEAERLRQGRSTAGRDEDRPDRAGLSRLRLLSPGYHRWITEDGDFDILTGASAADINDKITVTLGPRWNCLCSTASPPMGDWMADLKAAPSSSLCAGEIVGGMMRRMGGGEGDEESWRHRHGRTGLPARDAAARHPPLPGRRAAAKARRTRRRAAGYARPAGRLAVRQASTHPAGRKPGRIFANRLAACLGICHSEVSVSGAFAKFLSF